MVLAFERPYGYVFEIRFWPEAGQAQSLLKHADGYVADVYHESIDALEARIIAVRSERCP
jgi:hypothetical protein